jgi:hypothetical protein
MADSILTCGQTSMTCDRPTAITLAMVGRHTSQRASGTACQTATAAKQRLPDVSRRHSLLHSNSWTPEAVRRHPRRLGENKASVVDDVLGLRKARGGCKPGVRPRRPTQIARARKGVRAPASKGASPLQRQYARLFGKDKGAAAWAWLPTPAAAAAAAAAAVAATAAGREQERLRGRRAELQELQDLLADRLISKDNYVAEVSSLVIKWPHGGASVPDTPRARASQMGAPPLPAPRCSSQPPPKSPTPPPSFDF